MGLRPWIWWKSGTASTRASRSGGEPGCVRDGGAASDDDDVFAGRKVFSISTLILTKACPDGVKKDGHFSFPEIAKKWTPEAENSKFLTFFGLWKL